MGMDVYQARRHQLAGDIEHAQRALPRDVGLHCLDHAPTDADVATPAQVLAGIEHLAALDDEVELVVRARGGERGTATHCAGADRQQRSGLGEELAAGRNVHGVSSVLSLPAARRTSFEPCHGSIIIGNEPSPCMQACQPG
jgi:hypothetical protein